MKKALALVTFTLIYCAVFAQKDPMKFGEVPLEDLQMETYKQDTSAVAVILADFGEARVAPFQGKLVFERHIRIKILKAEGTSWADASVALRYSGSAEENLSGLKGITYNLENGKVVQTKMNSDAVFQEKFNKYLKLKKFTLPNVKVGSVIEYTYKIHSDFITMFPDWQFQYKIPSRYTEYRAYIPDFFVLEQYMNGYLGPQYDVKNFQQSNYSDVRKRWVMENVPAFKPEPYMTSESDYISRINFALSYINFPGQPSREIMGSWQKLVDNLLASNSFGKGISGNSFLKKKTDELLAGVTEPEKKMQIIYDYVKTSLKWNNISDNTAYELKDVFAAKTGSAGDINIALACMLDKAGFTVEPILLSTREHGFIRQSTPMSSQLNYVVCSVVLNDKRIMLDATERFLPLGILPERCLNGQGILVSPATKSFQWINLEALTKAKTVISNDFVLSPDGDFKGQVTFTRDGYDAIRSRKRYSNGEEEYVKSLVSGKAWEIEKSEFQTMDQAAGPMKEIHSLTINDHATVSGDLIYINPLMGFNQQENPFRIESRVYPVDFGSPFERLIMCKITIPDGYVVDESPQSRILTLPGGHGRYIYSVNVMGNVINVTSNLSLTKSLFLQTDYPVLREFYTQFIAKQNEQVVLKKK